MFNDCKVLCSSDTSLWLSGSSGWCPVLSEVHRLFWCGVTMFRGERMLNSS